MHDPVLEWLIREGAALADEEALVRELALRLRAEGLPIDRLWIGYARPHPLLAGTGALWQIDRGTSSGVVPYALRHITTPTEGPLAEAMATGRLTRLRFAEVARGGLGLLDELWDDGYVELCAIAFRWTGSSAVCTFCTRREGGFTEAEAERFAALRDVLALVTQCRDRGAFIDILAETYLGREVGRRVVDGAIHRGDGETIPAAIWFSDIRRFTSLSERLPLPELLAILDDAFEAQVAAITAHGGEVLKFIGDGLLAIFRGEGGDREGVGEGVVEGEGGDVQACQAALAAVRACVAAMVEINRDRVARGLVEIDGGIALHYGDLLFGNIGATTRLDFTVIGPAVNLAARIEGLCVRLGAPVVASAAFAARCPGECEAAGSFELKGVAGATAVHRVRLRLRDGRG
ncbi:MAG: adenylate/guanylate cyclase domain-containing protein [Nannocystaceae bacterium]